MDAITQTIMQALADSQAIARTLRAQLAQTRARLADLEGPDDLSESEGRDRPLHGDGPDVED